VLERYYAEICCSDDREYYRIVAALENSDLTIREAKAGQPDVAATPISP